jgi:methylated-DNA-[protein]-cysteine S-methyltransferase
MTFTYDSPFGPLFVETRGEAIVRLGFGSAAGRGGSPVRAQLDEYFAGERTCFDFEFSLGGTEFERRVWQEVSAIPYGQTATYAEIARRIGRPSACRAVGRANGRNPVALVVPCHRVIGSNGSLTGYAGGLDMKRGLLELERSSIDRQYGSSGGPG